MTRLVYILAASHSGSTLLAMLFGSHPEVCTVGELKATSLGDTNRYRCSCGSAIRTCPFWNRVTEEMGKRGFEFDITRAGTGIHSGMGPFARKLLSPLCRTAGQERFRDAALAFCPSWRTGLPRIQARNAGLAETVLHLTGKKILVDSSKIGLRLKYLLRNPALDIRIVRLIRDGRGVALTYTDPIRFADAKDPRLHAGGMGGNRDASKLPMADAAREWKRSNEEADALLATVDPTRWTQVRYEDLCADPEGVMRRLVAFVGADPARVTLDFRNTEHHVVGNGMRLDSTKEIAPDERWRSVLRKPDLEIFDSIAGSTCRRLGYQ